MDRNQLVQLEFIRPFTDRYFLFQCICLAIFIKSHYNNKNAIAYDTSVIVMAFDENGQADTLEKKVSISESECAGMGI